MRQFFLLFFLMACLWIPRMAEAQGTVQTVSLFSNALGATEQFQIYLPEGYDPGGAETYPVVYFLHGATFNFTSYPCLLDSLDALIGSGAIKPVIVVKPDGTQGPYNAGMYTNSSLNGNVEDYIIDDLIAYIDAHYKTKAERQYRCIFGHSMGAMGSAFLALKHPGMFRAFAAISGAMDFSQFNLFFNFVVTADYPAGPPYNYNSAKFYTGLIFAASSGYSPHPGNNPPVDLPIDIQGNTVDSVMAKWSAFDPALKVIQSPPDSALGIYFDCGQQDEFKFYPMNLGFRDSLDKAGLAYTFKSFQGGHANKICERMPVALRYLDSMMTAPIVPAPEIKTPEKLAVYPNPATAEVTLPLGEEGPCEIRIFDLNGRLVIGNTIDGREGKVNIAGLPAGMYILKAHGGGMVRTAKLVKQK